MAMIGKIRRMYLRQGKSVREISRITSLSRNTIKKWLEAPLNGEPKYRRRAQANKLTSFHEAIKLALKADAHRPKKEQRTALALYAEVSAAGYQGCYSRVTDFIRAWRQGEGKGAATTAFVPLSFELGEAFQFDWSEEGLVVGGIYYRIQVSHMKLCASRAFWLVAYPSQGHEMLFDAHTRSFAALGGIPRRGIYDNMKTAVDKVEKGKGRIVNARFAVMCAHYLFDADFCNVASGWEKGVVEKNDQFSVAEMLEHEQPHLMPMPEPFDGYMEKPARVSSTCLVAVARNRYSVPCELVGQMVSTRLYPGRIVIVAGDAIVASHERLGERGQVKYDWQHYISLLERKPGALRNGAPFVDMPEPLQKLRCALLRHSGGDRVMAQVLAIVPSAGIEAVLVAAELALESGPPSGGVSVEHVLNILSRLNAVPVPENAQTSLQVSTPPLADTARYDGLRAQEITEEIGHA